MNFDNKTIYADKNICEQRKEDLDNCETLDEIESWILEAPCGEDLTLLRALTRAQDIG